MTVMFCCTSTAAASIQQVIAAADVTTNAIQAWGPVIAAFASFVAAIATAIVSYNAINRTLWQKTNENEAAEITQKLDHFYGPFFLLAEENLIFANELRSRANDPSKFRLLVSLATRNWQRHLSPFEKGLVAELCKNAETLDNMIHANLGLVNEKLRDYFALASAHYRMLVKAGRGELGNDPTVVEPYVYPRALLPVMKLEESRLKARRQYLREQPTKPPPVIPELQIPEEPEYQLPKNLPDPLGLRSNCTSN